MFQPNYELIGTIHAMECFRNTLPQLIDRFEAITDNDYGIMASTKLTLGITIELCAEHFYGIDLQDSIGETIELIRSMDQELQFS